MSATPLIPVYSIYDRDIPRAHLRACVIVNPIGPAPKDWREPQEKAIAGCEAASCTIQAKNGEAAS